MAGTINQQVCRGVWDAEGRKAMNKGKSQYEQTQQQNTTGDRRQ